MVLQPKKKRGSFLCEQIGQEVIEQSHTLTEEYRYSHQSKMYKERDSYKCTCFTMIWNARYLSRDVARGD